MTSEPEICRPSAEQVAEVRAFVEELADARAWAELARSRSSAAMAARKGTYQAQSVDKKAEKVRENRLRRTAQRQGLELHKSRQRDPHGRDFGTYWLIDPTIQNVVLGRIPGDFVVPAALLDDIEAYLTGG